MKTDAGIVSKYKELEQHAGRFGLRIEQLNDKFAVNAPTCNGLIIYKTIGELEIFLHGYGVAYDLHKRNAL